jgi:hypothetical protein
MSRYKKYGGRRLEVCKSLGICVRTFNNWKNSFEKNHDSLKKRRERDYFGRPKVRIESKTK